MNSTEYPLLQMFRRAAVSRKTRVWLCVVYGSAAWLGKNSSHYFGPVTVILISMWLYYYIFFFFFWEEEFPLTLTFFFLNKMWKTWGVWDETCLCQMFEGADVDMKRWNASHQCRECLCQTHMHIGLFQQVLLQKHSCLDFFSDWLCFKKIK